jgi:hypothetical protein
MVKLRHTTLFLGALVTFAIDARAQQPQQGQAPSSQSSQGSSQTTTTTTHSAPSPDLNTNTNSGPDITGSSGHPEATTRTKGNGELASAMANFSVRTGLEVRPDTMAQVVVQTVRPNSPGARAGVEPGDVITNLSGTEINTMGSLQKLLTGQPLQGAYFVSLKRGDHNFRVPLGRQLTLMGMTVFADTGDRPVVKAVETASPAERAGFKVGDVITGVDRQNTETMAKLLDFAIPFMRNLSQGQGIPFRLVRDGKPIHFSVTRPADADLPQLTADQERHLRRMANGDDEKARNDEKQRSTTRKTTRTTRNKQQMNSMNGQMAGQRNQNAGGVVGGVDAGIGNAGIGGAGLGATGVDGAGGLGGAGFGGVGFGGGGLGSTGTTGTGMSGAGTNGSSNVNAAVAVLRGTPANSNQTLSSQQGGTSSGQNSGSSGLGAGVVGFVQIQANVGLNNGNGTGNGIGNINPSAPGSNPLTGNTTTNTGVNPRTGNAATNTLNPGAAAMSPAQMQQQQQGQQQQGVGQGVQQGVGQGLQQGSGGAQSGVAQGVQQGVQQGLQQGQQQAGMFSNGSTGTNTGVNATNGVNGTNNQTNNGTTNQSNNGTGATQSFVSARVSGIPAGNYSLAVNQFGDCGDSAGSAPGPAALTLGSITVNANGQGTLQNQTINFLPQAFLGRTVSLIPVQGTGGQSTSTLAGCGKFVASNPNSAFIGGAGQNGSGNGFPGNQGTGTGMSPVTGTGTGTGTGTSPTNPANPTGPNVPAGPLPMPRFP